MDFVETVLSRCSIRAFKPDPIPEETLKQILEVAKRSPSYSNTQPWEVAVVTGKKRDELSKILTDLFMADTPNRNDTPHPGRESWPPALAQRSFEHGMHRFKHVGIEREDKVRRKENVGGNFRFYGAPCAMFLYMDRVLGPWSYFDMGSFAQTLILTAYSFGVDSCLQAQLTNYPDVVHKALGIPDTKKFVIGISMGYRLGDSTLNSYHSERVSPDVFAKWLK